MTASPERPGAVRKFNPGTLQSDEEVKRLFVVRQPKLDIVLEVLRGNVDSPSCQHMLIVAPRGRGKTMLLARTAAALRVGGTLSERLLPVRFMEESQEIFTLADFWLEALFHLARESRQRDAELARELQEAHAELAAGWRGEGLAERVRATVLEASDRLGRKLVLMVENLQAMCGSVDDDFGWKLRRVLQSDPQIILLATATSRFKGLDDAREPFFELFRIVRLEPLDTAECTSLWRAVSGDTASEREVRPLEILTGGNPRLLVIVAGFARHRSLRQLMEELVVLIDDHTEYFRAHLQGFAKTERRVYLAVIDLWQSSSTGEIAARARMDVRPVSTLLGRLVERGAVVVEGSGRKRRYVAAERLYSIYYKLRRERDEAAVVQSLIQFMAAFYTEGELAEMSDGLKAEAAMWPAIQEGFSRAFAITPEVRLAFSGEMWRGMEEPSGPALALDDEKIAQILDEIRTAIDESAFERIIEIADRWLAGKNGAASGVPVSVGARILNAKGFACARLDQSEAAAAAWGQVIEQFGGSDAPEVQGAVAMAWANRGALHRDLGEYDAAVTACDEFVARFGNAAEPAIQALIAKTLANKAVALEQLGEHAAAVAACDETVVRFGDSDAPEIQGAAAEALASKANVLERLGEAEAAIATFDEVLERFGTIAASEVHGPVARALLSKVVASVRLGDHQETIAASDELLARFDASDASEVQLPIALAQANKAFALGEIGKTDVAISVCDEVVERFGAGQPPEVRLPIAMALNCKANLQLQAGNTAEAEAAWGEVIERFVHTDAPEFSALVALASFSKKLARGQPGKLVELMAVYDRAVEYLGADGAAQLRLPIAMMLVGTGAMQARTGHPEEALRTCDELERWLDSLADDEKTRFQWLTGWIRTQALARLHRYPDVMDTLRSVYLAFVPGDETMMSQMVTGVLDLISAGAPERDVLKVLTTDAMKAAGLTPLLTALRQRAGEAVRAPPEVLEVAADICKLIEEGAHQNVSGPG